MNAGFFNWLYVIVGGYTKFNGLKSYNKALKTLIAIGGWYVFTFPCFFEKWFDHFFAIRNEGSRRFSNLVSDAESRKNFIKHAIRFLRQYQFDGLDLDWGKILHTSRWSTFIGYISFFYTEYPASREGGVPEDKSNYAQFIKVISLISFHCLWFLTYR